MFLPRCVPRAVEILRMASASNHMSLLIARDEETRREFTELMRKYGSSNNSGTDVSSPTSVSTGKLTDTASSSSSSRSTSPPLPSSKEGGVAYTASCTIPSTPQVFSDSMIQLICVAKATGLGLIIKGGANRMDGPMVYIQEILPGGDCQKDGRLKAGDQLVCINKESLIGVTYEEARAIITRTKVRPDPTVEIAFIRRRSSGSSSSGSHSPISLFPTSPASGPQPRPTGTGPVPLPGSLIPKAPPAPSAANATLPSVKQTRVQEMPVKAEGTSLTCPESACTTVTKSDASPASKPDNRLNPEKKHVLNPTSRFKLETLEKALEVVGLKPTETQRQTLREHLRADPGGTVVYGDFERVTKELLKLQIDESGFGKEVARFESDDLMSEASSYQPGSTSDSEDLDEMKRLRKEHIKALREIKKLQERLAESEILHGQLQEELVSVKQEAKSAAEEARALRTRVHLAEAAQKQARGMEMDYEEVIRLLEAEIADMKSQLVERPVQAKGESQGLRKRIAVLECQFRKTEKSKKVLEVSTGKLLDFVEVVHSFLVEDPSPQRNCSSPGEPKFVAMSQTLGTRGGKKHQWSASSIVKEAKELTRSIRGVLEMDSLPYGWEEAYTADGMKYYINHVTQMTSWTHPLTCSLGLAENELEDLVGPVPDCKS
uniref:Syntaxin binding protein 4 n=1 Tax=Denticeps clupeoides TaxID=299321 RepID=A0AAY4AL13_9TELE